MNVVDEVFALYEQGGSKTYFGEGVTQLQHALQTAHCAREAEADDEAVLRCTTNCFDCESGTRWRKIRTHRSRDSRVIAG
jgi:hypothetical protein